jgi:hypothetical protein
MASKRRLAPSKRNLERRRKTSKKNLMMLTLIAVVMSVTAGLLTVGAVARVSNGLANGEHFHLPLRGLFFIVALLLAAIGSIIAWLRAVRSRE